MDKEEERFLDSISRSPWAHPLRLEYAAWIERQGDSSRSEQAEFLRLDVEYEQMEAIDGTADVYHPERFSQVGDRLRELRYSLDPHWLVRVDRDLAIPPDLCPAGKMAAQVIVQFLLAEGLTYPGGPAFRSPEDKDYAEEEFADDALLLLFHDGGDIKTCVSREWGEQELIDRFENHLLRHGFVRKACMGWYSAICPLIGFKPFRVEIGSG